MTDTPIRTAQDALVAAARENYRVICEPAYGVDKWDELDHIRKELLIKAMSSALSDRIQPVTLQTARRLRG